MFGGDIFGVLAQTVEIELSDAKKSKTVRCFDSEVLRIVD